MVKLREEIERWKAKAEFFLNNKINAFIIDTSDNYYFCNIVSLDKDYIYVKHFDGKKIGNNERILWFDIVKFDEYKEKEGQNGN